MINDNDKSHSLCTLGAIFLQFRNRVPPGLRDEWNSDGKIEKPDVNFEVEWVYGYRGKDPSGGRNIYQVYDQQ